MPVSIMQSTKAWFAKADVKQYERPVQSPDRNPTRMSSSVDGASGIFIQHQRLISLMFLWLKSPQLHSKIIPGEPSMKSEGDYNSK